MNKKIGYKLNNKTQGGVMKSTVKVIIFSLLACSLVFTNDVKTEVII